MAIINDKKELTILKEGGKILASVLLDISREVKHGVKGEYLDNLFEKLVLERGGKPSFKNYRPKMSSSPYPASLCLSLNDEVVHGIPFGKIIKDGDLVSLDAGLFYKGFFTDSAITIFVGKPKEEITNFITICKKALNAGIGVAKAGVKVGAIGQAVQKTVEEAGYSVVRDLIGHGVGLAVHESPEVPNFGLPSDGEVLKEGEIIAIEPMINMGGYKIILDADGWTWRTKDGSNSAHFEHTVRITKSGGEVLTM